MKKDPKIHVAFILECIGFIKTWKVVQNEIPELMLEKKNLEGEDAG